MIYSKDAIVGEKTRSENFELVKDKLKTHGEVIVIGEDEKQVYKVTYLNTGEKKRPKAKCKTLVEAIERVLAFASRNTLHVDQIVKEIENGKLYYKRDGSVAKREDVRATAQNYPQKFECLKGNNIRLKG